MSVRVIDLFCGCGGISWGLKSLGAKILAGFDLDRDALSTFSLNFPDSKSVLCDLSEINEDNFDFIECEPDLVVGGPPCQGFSKNVPRSYRYLDDPKNLLIRSFIKSVNITKPKCFLMENVAEMARSFDSQYTNEVIENFSNIGYECHFEIHNSSHYGVPQKRRRVIFWGQRAPIVWPKSSMNQKFLNTLNTVSYTNVWDAIGDLSPLADENSIPNSYSSDPFSNYQKIMRIFEKPLSDHELRKLKPTQQERYNILEPGQGIKDLPDHLRPKSGYSGAYGRLTKSMLAPTITRWVFHPGSGRYGHPVERRIISIREAARLQSFSDDFLFHGTNQSKSSQIGNAVPPLLISKIIFQLLDSLKCLPPRREPPATGGASTPASP